MSVISHATSRINLYTVYSYYALKRKIIQGITDQKSWLTSLACIDEPNLAKYLEELADLDAIVLHSRCL